MNKIHLITWIAITFIVSAFKSDVGSSQYKCMIQLTNYSGEGAYIVVSVLNANKEYVETLRVLGDDEEWYPDLPTWWSFFEKAGQENVDAITGATIAGGERSIFILDIDDRYLDNGHFLRFETSVEHQNYVENDVLLPLKSSSISGKFEGSDYIRYVRLIPN
ncbi:DUF2271 domain-containing protein [Marinoscillum furvescens]|uniref:Uncharacterized protein DUF2271 n=1 Tax=Marinoscillum furvescens DSM 4134 TaxID=1122208 RepID=A0A3D9L083_MARFU|nr:DUF2271 domain-containing protein [Marinoscillum furvescens]RED96579.1 uncharacterized protein DUF2271 [Marinoscillum furvescens DSM 4134]